MFARLQPADRGTVFYHSLAVYVQTRTDVVFRWLSRVTTKFPSTRDPLLSWRRREDVGGVRGSYMCLETSARVEPSGDKTSPTEVADYAMPVD